MLGRLMPIARVSSGRDAPSYPRFQKTSIAASSAFSESKARGRPLPGWSEVVPRLIFIPLNTLFHLTRPVHGVYFVPFDTQTRRSAYVGEAQRESGRGNRGVQGDRGVDRRAPRG